MFGFRKSRPPLSTAQRVDIELLMRRTVEKLGARHVREIEVVGRLEQLQLEQSSPRLLIEAALRELQNRMPTMEQPCEVEIVAASDLGYPSVYRTAADNASAKIRVSDETLSDPLRTLMELSYQYASHYWHTLPARTELDIDPRTTNLMPICCGLGVLASDACFYDQQWTQAGWTGWSISRSGYYTADEIGYALALLARLRGEAKPAWSQGLRLDSIHTFRKGMAYFRQLEKDGGALLFDAETLPSSTGDMRQLSTWLRGDDPSFAMAAGLALRKLDDLSPLAIEAALLATRRGDRDVVPVATRVLGNARQRSVETESRLRQLIRHDRPQVALAAVESASRLGMSLSEHGKTVSKLLEVFADDPFSLLEVIGREGRSFEFLAAKICQCVARSIGQKDDELTMALLECLNRIVADPRHSLETAIKSPEALSEAIRRFESAPVAASKLK